MHPCLAEPTDDHGEFLALGGSWWGTERDEGSPIHTNSILECNIETDMILHIDIQVTILY